jgi:hypothetical protein
VTDAPGHDKMLARITAVTALIGTEHPRDVFSLGWLLGKEQAHK